MLQSLRTVVFADLTGSTGLFESVGNVMATQLITRAIQCVGGHLAQAGGRVVKYLGDGVMVMFDDVEVAIDVCVGLPGVLRNLADRGPLPVPLAVKVGIDCGAIVEHDGDCYGDAVNVASRLSDLAQANEILLSGAVHQRLRDEQRAGCHSLDRISIKGKSEAVKVWRVDWGRTAETTLIFPVGLGDGDADAPREQCRLELSWLDEQRVLGAAEEPLVIGRGEEAGFVINDPRVSRRHARIEWSGGQCMLTDFSSNGTWVRPAGSAQALLLRRDGIILHGEGELALGAPPDDFTVPTLSFRVLG
ncbi:adenylate/guanylate cyclase domain-containing protein [Pseudothauera nasutitermitis]|uniref:Adenylate/guanylate cyclase domain-containing protein n=1 Tax=Pseudothauera nasutitermitis TaxID=2565930 RepID=A0A4S4ANA8_9RHOO|nr:adenylate/guanylate cyclase domain-containing protein [Pseudothauera nasutitermitis]THF61124.1 adenylate/guanylate cyclase domain-containing protein [Pseudothauera nasutitermitis]